MSLFDRYGIKEVADVTFYTIKDGKPEKPVLYLDTLKVSTVEQTAENTESRGGKGNAALMAWDYGKEITVNLEDALFSQKSLEVMYSDIGASKALKNTRKTTYVTFTKKTKLWNYDGVNYVNGIDESIELPTNLFIKNSKTYLKIDGKDYSGKVMITLNGHDFVIGTASAALPLETIENNKNAFELDGEGLYILPGTYICEVELDTTNNNLKGYEIEITAETFPGTYYVTADTFARNEKTGKDEFFQLVFPKVKVLSESNTITLEADGEPTVFNMTLKVLKTGNQPMIRLIQYTPYTGAGTPFSYKVRVSGWATDYLEGTVQTEIPNGAEIVFESLARADSNQEAEPTGVVSTEASYFILNSSDGEQYQFITLESDEAAKGDNEFEEKEYYRWYRISGYYI